PLNLVAHKVAPVIACGNTIVVKPSPRTPLSALLLGEVILHAGAPPGQVNVIVTPNEHAALAVSDPRVKCVSFTGSVPVGWSIATLAKRKRVTLELGGNAAVIVHADADLDAAVPLISTGAFSYAGQSCISVQRVFVHGSIRAEFERRLVAHVTKNVLCGDPRRSDVLVGPMIDAGAQSRVLGAIDAARAAGARLLCGGVAEGPCILPTILADADPRLGVCATEIFGPVMTINSYEDFDAAMHLVNDSPYGLQAGVFTRDLSLAMRAFEVIEVGGVMINHVPTFRLENMPYGGMKDSGIGREGVRFAIEEMTERKALVVRLQ
ncbi:MAG: aldehyde dehydrogenase family protein, partial [Tepidisphaeraceae bacterium]